MWIASRVRKRSFSRLQAEGAACERMAHDGPGGGIEMASGQGKLRGGAHSPFVVVVLGGIDDVDDKHVVHRLPRDERVEVEGRDQHRRRPKPVDVQPPSVDHDQHLWVLVCGAAPCEERGDAAQRSQHPLSPSLPAATDRVAP